MSFNFIQISDLHLFADECKKLNGITTYQSLKAILQDIQQKKLEYDFFCITGDIAEAGEEQAYWHAQQLLKATGKPFFWIPGNHDSLLTMQGFSEKIGLNTETAFIHHDWQFILLNSMVTGKSFGQVSEKTLSFLKTRLQEYPQYPTLIALHHNPLPTNTSWADAIMLQKAENFLQLLYANPQVKGVLYGHIHQPYETQKQGIKFFSSPSTCFHIKHGTPTFELDGTDPGYYEFKVEENEVNAQLRRVNIEQTPLKDY